MHSSPNYRPQWRPPPAGRPPGKENPPARRTPPGKETPLARRPPDKENHPWQGDPPPRHTVNERLVRIILECILVCVSFGCITIVLHQLSIPVTGNYVGNLALGTDEKKFIWLISHYTNHWMIWISTHTQFSKLMSNLFIHPAFISNFADLINFWRNIH